MVRDVAQVPVRDLADPGLDLADTRPLPHGSVDVDEGETLRPVEQQLLLGAGGSRWGQRGPRAFDVALQAAQVRVLTAPDLGRRLDLGLEAAHETPRVLRLVVSGVGVAHGPDATAGGAGRCGACVRAVPRSRLPGGG